MDLGLTMLQRWWRQVYLPHLLVAVPLMAAAIGIGWYFERAWIALAITWWLKPVYDRVVLHVLSRAVFGELQSTRAVLGAWREWLGTGIVSALLLRRLWIDLDRSFVLPVRQLEGQTGRAGRERRAVLGRRVGGYAAWLTMVTFALEVIVLWTAFGLLTELFLPAKADEGKGILELLFGDTDDGRSVFTFEDALAYALAVLILEPFYVAAGFALYLYRRTLLEGWDIEVALRRIAQRHGVSLVMLVMAALFMVPPAYAQDKDPKAEIAEVLKAKEFGYSKEVKRWEPRVSEKAGDFDTTWLRALAHALSKAGELVLWVGAAALLAYALWWASRMLPRGGAPAPEPYHPPAALFGMELAPEKLPPDVAAAAAALAREGRLREALGLLYRGALSELVHKRGVQLLASHTEGDVLRLSGESSSVFSYLKALINAWQRCAYASQTPQSAEVERLASDYGKAFA